MQPTDAIEWVSNVTYVVCALAAVRLWRQRRDAPPARWLMITFAILSAVILSTFWIPEDAELPRLLVAAILGVILVFPWTLFRFADSLTGERPRQVRVVSVATAIVVVWGFLIPEFPAPGEPQPTAITVYVFALLGAWAMGTGLTAWRLFRAGRGQPSVIRSRVRLLGSGALLLTLTLLVSAINTGRDATAPDNAVAIIAGLLSMFAAITFLAGFAPPRLLRTSWRQPEEQELHRASTRLMSATSPGEVASIVLPPFRRLVGADAIALTSGEVTLGTFGDPSSFETTPHWRLFEAADDKLAVRAVMSQSAPLFGQDERHMVERLLLVADLAVDRASRAHDLEVANQQLASANEELEAFVYSASHDLKNPLIALLGYVDLLKSKAPFDPAGEESMFLDRIEANGWFMSSLIQDLLELSRVGRVEDHHEHVDLGVIVDNARDTVAAQFPGMSVVVGGRLPTVVMNRTRALQLVTNVLVNAGRHAGPQSQVVVTTELTGDGLRVVLEDDGPGIDPSQADRIFRVFERLDADASDGNGIGLSICRKIAQAIGGDMVLERSDRGARFVVTIPPANVVDDVDNHPPSNPVTQHGQTTAAPALTRS